MARVDIYGGKDPRLLPAYTVPMAAHYLRMSPQTLRTWVEGYSYLKSDGSRTKQPRVIEAAGKLGGRPYLSFQNLIEAHVLASIRRGHEISLPKVRKSLLFIADKFGTEHPLAQERFATYGAHLFVEKFGTLINVSKDGQSSILHALEQGLDRIVYVEGSASRLFPVVRSALERVDEQPKIVVIDPRLSFGRPVIDGSGVPVSEIAERFQAGDSLEHLAEDFGLSFEKVQEALRAAA